MQKPERALSTTKSTKDKKALRFFKTLIWKEQVVCFVRAASSCDHLISRLEAAPTGFFKGKINV
jgi:hypothetical protein